MAPKRKSDVLEPVLNTTDPAPATSSGVVSGDGATPSAAKKVRTNKDAGEGSSSGTKKGRVPARPADWREVVLEGEEVRA